MAEAAVTADGDILAMKVAMTVDTGAYPGMGGMISGLIETMLPGPYKSAHWNSRSPRPSRTRPPTLPTGAVGRRGVHAERSFDIVADQLGMDPLELRLRNVAPSGEAPLAMITGRSLVGVTTSESLEPTAEIVDLPAFRTRQAAARTEGRYLGLGIAPTSRRLPARGPKAARSGHGPGAGAWSSSRDGTVSVYTAQMPHGQSHETTFAQIAAHEMGVRSNT